ncbi:MAG: hypothetical protein PHU14_06395, partial [Methylovulum sp.]|nr:hypothetical protein [Methylovulum sp.]
ENGFDHQALPAKAQGLEIAREFTNLDGKPITHVKIGEEFLVKLNIRSTERDKASAIALVDLLPGGIEPVLNAKPEADASEEDNAATEEENPESGGSEAETEAATGDTATSTWQGPLGESKGSDWRPEYVDIREDRVILYGTVGRSIGTFIYRVRATNAGHYTVPAPFAEGMYDRKLQARGTAGELLVETP